MNSYGALIAKKGSEMLLFTFSIRVAKEVT
jgi:hypothetical protein